MTAPVRHAMFEGIIYDVAAGNVNTLFHCVDKDTKDTFVVMCGVTACPRDGEEIPNNELTEEDARMMEDVPSIPFKIDFNIPVVKVCAGDLFAGMLTAEGSVHTWGYNNYGQLGLKQERTIFVQWPN